MNEAYFSRVVEGDEVFGLVFGLGKVSSVWENSHYSFEVEYTNGSVVPYTSAGIPAWSGGKLDFQTVFYKTDIYLFDFDFSPVEKVLSAKKIIKLRNKKELLVRCPSGLWQSVEKCPSFVVETYLVEGKLHLFKHKQKETLVK